MLALALYAVSSLAGGLAGDPGLIIAARAVQGVGGALLLPSTLSLINTLFAEGPQRNRALAVWGGAGASGLTLGALLGGVLTENFGWPAVFFVNVPLAGFVALAALFVIPRDPAQGGAPEVRPPGCAQRHRRVHPAGLRPRRRTRTGLGRPAGARRARVLPYFLTVLMQTVHGYSALQTASSGRRCGSPPPPAPRTTSRASPTASPPPP
ncbi:MFS transporter [Spirillospora sp. CA-294931]|uniref:MFS transporter n=1 Tax=Spirillospora sp. CA-294931 TaxID=3240042 RepID=UPI003D92CCA2